MAITLGTAVGAFLAGVVLFFVSVGMLVNLNYLIANAGYVFVLTALIVVGKSTLTVLLGMFFRRPARTALVVAAGLSQIGEFSFIVGQAGVSLGVLMPDQYSLILAGSLLSIMVSPLMFRTIPRAEAALRKMPFVWKRLDRHVPQPRLGDAANSDVLNHAGLDHARALVVTVPDEAAAEMIVAAARQAAPGLPVVARAATRSGVQRLRQLGAKDAIHPELEGGLEVLRYTLLALEAQRYADAVRHDQYDTAVNTAEEHQVLETMMRATRSMEILWAPLPADSSLVGQTLAEANIRARTEASVIAVPRGQQLIDTVERRTNKPPLYSD